jgi:hypothetical protein
MRISEEQILIYRDVCACKSEECLKLAEIRNRPEEGSPPRGFYTEASGPVEILVVGKNPGHVLESEATLYKKSPGAETAKIHLSFSRDVFFGHRDFSAREKPSTRFHSNLLVYLSEILDCDQSDVFTRAAYTNLVKCSSAENEQAKLSQATMHICFGKHLSRELEFYKPIMILALGREVEHFLVSLQQIACPVGYLKHPSYPWASEKKSKQLSYLKSVLNGLAY